MKQGIYESLVSIFEDILFYTHFINIIITFNFEIIRIQ